MTHEMSELKPTEKELESNGLMLIEETYFRLQGWGLPDDWREHPHVRVPTDHAEKIIRHGRCLAILRRLVDAHDNCFDYDWFYGRVVELDIIADARKELDQ